MIQNDYPSNTTKSEIVTDIVNRLKESSYNITEINDQKPWGAYIRIDERNIDQFNKEFFNNQVPKQNALQTPKILIVGPNQRLSWQYHHRRKEIWSVIAGPIDIARSMNNSDQNISTYGQNLLISLEKEERHRLIGKETWGIVAEIWVHTDLNNPSDEEDIVRISDDYNRVKLISKI